MCQVICWPHVKHITIHKKSNPIDGKLFKLFENLANYLCRPGKCCGMVAWLSALIPGAIVFMQQIAHRDWFYPQVQEKMDQTKLGRNYAKFSGKIWSASGCAKMNQSGRIQVKLTTSPQKHMYLPTLSEYFGSINQTSHKFPSFA